MRTVRTLIVDDEPNAREGLRHLLASHPDVTVVGECGDGRSALSAIRTLSPDLVFLDVQMPELDGLGVVRAVGATGLPVVVFVTAYDRYALKAFEAHAVDYLLKPFTDERFCKALEQAKSQIERIRHGELGRNVAALVSTEVEGKATRARLAVRTANGVVLILAETIDWVDADGDHVRIHAAKATHVVRQTMRELEADLDANRFVRIHRSTIVNLDRVKELQPFYRGDYVAVLVDGTRLRVSRSCRSILEARLGRRF